MLEKSNKGSHMPLPALQPYYTYFSDLLFYLWSPQTAWQWQTHTQFKSVWWLWPCLLLLRNFWSVTIPLPSDLLDDSSWIGIALFTSVVILENLNNVSSGQDDVSFKFICKSDIIQAPRITCPSFFNFSENLPEPLRHASSFGLKVIIPAGKLRDHLEDCSCIMVFIRCKCTYIKIEMCGARVLYKQDLGKFLQASGKMKQISRLCQVSPYSFT